MKTQLLIALLFASAALAKRVAIDDDLEIGTDGEADIGSLTPEKLKEAQLGSKAPIRYEIASTTSHRLDFKFEDGK
jgi:hypothetical protein